MAKEIYRPLSPGQMRLLVATPGFDNRTLTFRFTHVLTSSSLEYTAISYTWDHEAASEIITIDGSRLLVKKNLWAALHCLKREWQYIWADAICIDQENLRERNQQVKMMGQIYAGAQVVSVWLGLPKLPDWVNVEGPIVTVETDEFDWEENMVDLAGRQYWKRVWTIQEFWLAKGLQIYCGNQRLDWLSFEDSLKIVAKIKQTPVELDYLLKRPKLLAKWPPLAFLAERNAYDGDPIGQSLYDLLVSHAEAQCTDPRDKVFALMGLIREDERLGMERSFPDYSLSEDVVLAITLIHLNYFNKHEPVEPILRALRLGEMEKPRLYLLIRAVVEGEYMLFEDAMRFTRDFYEEQLAIATFNDDELRPMPDVVARRLRQPGQTITGLFRRSDVPDAKPVPQFSGSAKRTMRWPLAVIVITGMVLCAVWYLWLRDWVLSRLLLS